MPSYKKSVGISKDDHEKLDAILRQIQKFKHTYVKVGVLEGTTRRKGKGKNKVKFMAMIAAVHEYGSVKRRIPERSFIRSWVNIYKKQINNFILLLLRGVEDGKYTCDMALKKLGAFGVGGIKMRIREVKKPPLAEVTIKRKKSTQPLIDTGQLRNGIQYQVVKIKYWEDKDKK